MNLDQAIGVVTLFIIFLVLIRKLDGQPGQYVVGGLAVLILPTGVVYAITKLVTISALAGGVAIYFAIRDLKARSAT